MTVKDILNMTFPSQFGSDEDGEDTYSIEDVYNQLDNFVQTTYGASKFVIFLNEKEVVKVPFNGCYWYDENAEDGLRFDQFTTTDYCAIEAAIYADAVANGLEKFFASTKYAGMTIDRTPIYVSERVYTFYDNDRVREKTNSFSENSREQAIKFKEKIGFNIHIEWLARAIEYYGAEMVDKLLQFIKEREINDFHTENIGFRENGSPCILDYSGYRE